MRECQGLRATAHILGPARVLHSVRGIAIENPLSFPADTNVQVFRNFYTTRGC